MAKVISIYSNKEPSLLDVETLFSLNEGEPLQSSIINLPTAETISIEQGDLFSWEVFSNELEFE